MEVNPIFTTYLHELKRYCYSITGNPWDGEDLYQDTLLNIMRRASTIELHQNPKGYLFKMAINQWRDIMRKRKKEKTVEQECNIHYTDVNFKLLETVEVLISELPFQQACVLLLTEYFGFTSKEISEMLTITIGAVKATLHRARVNLTQMKNTVPTNEPPEQLILRLLTSLKENNARIVASTYRILITRGIKIKKKDHHFIFTVTDPDGNKYNIIEKI
ncbi:RNA polymerase sigma factor [Salirhabdus sp. Marseille-P4669]|uniref:RNA polymerase sigma factor n=1 Tax=Salirhabdus sp. Marseille-P4669 TaxID=2042310 RepID=UPI000C7D7CE4|nr:RNA polymerase sigma factor [Salirhabdus sp. Marseille-P4669]